MGPSQSRASPLIQRGFALHQEGKLEEARAIYEEILKLETGPVPRSKTALQHLIADKEREMREAAKRLDFELAAILRDEIKELYKKTGKQK